MLAHRSTYLGGSIFTDARYVAPNMLRSNSSARGTNTARRRSLSSSMRRSLILRNGSFVSNSGSTNSVPPTGSTATIHARSRGRGSAVVSRIPTASRCLPFTKASLRVSNSARGCQRHRRESRKALSIAPTSQQRSPFKCRTQNGESGRLNMAGWQGHSGRVRSFRLNSSINAVLLPSIARAARMESSSSITFHVKQN